MKGRCRTTKSQDGLQVEQAECFAQSRNLENFERRLEVFQHNACPGKAERIVTLQLENCCKELLLQSVCRWSFQSQVLEEFKSVFYWVMRWNLTADPATY